MGFMSLLHEDAALGKIDRIMDSAKRMECAVLRMKENIDDLLELSRVGRIQYNFEIVHIGQVLQKILQPLEQIFRDRKITVHVQRDLPNVWADKHRIGEVFDNLVTNALK